MIHLVTLNPALDVSLTLREPWKGKIGEVLEAEVEAGGKGLNVSRFLKKLGVRSATWLGTGGETHPTHVLFRSLLKREGLSAQFLGGKSSVRFNVVIQKKKQAQKYNHPGFELDLVSFPRMYKVLKKGDFLVMTGRLPQGMNRGLYASWIHAFGRKGVKTVVDTSGKSLPEALEAKPWFFKVNLFEISEALKVKFTNLDQVARFLPQLIKLGFLHGAVTHGSEGAILWNGNKACRVRSKEKVRNAFVVGAGDAFLAGYLKGLQTHESFEVCAKLACATGTAVAVKGIAGFDARLAGRLLKSVRVKNI